jgi:hypothetical protein
MLMAEATLCQGSLNRGPNRRRDQLHRGELAGCRGASGFSSRSGCWGAIGVTGGAGCRGRDCGGAGLSSCTRPLLVKRTDRLQVQLAGASARGRWCAPRKEAFS